MHPHLFPSTAPTAPPAGVTTTTSGISITVSWSPVPCLQRNSNITGYAVRYTEVTSRRATSEEIIVDGGSTTSKTISGLAVSVRYSIQVAAVGAGVTRVFSDPVIADESEQYRGPLLQVLCSTVCKCSCNVCPPSPSEQYRETQSELFQLCSTVCSAHVNSISL